MKNKFLRLLVVLTKLMTAEKMQLDKFLRHGEYLAYRIKLPPPNQTELVSKSIKSFEFEFSCHIDDKSYEFTNLNIDDTQFQQFEKHLSVFLNQLFTRKNEFERETEVLSQVVNKLHQHLTQEEKTCLAAHIDTNTKTVLKILGEQQ